MRLRIFAAVVALALVLSGCGAGDFTEKFPETNAEITIGAPAETSPETTAADAASGAIASAEATASEAETEPPVETSPETTAADAASEAVASGENNASEAETEPPAETSPETTAADAASGAIASAETTASEAETEPPEETPPDASFEEEKYVPEYGEHYYDVDNVVLYLYNYGELPPFITKKEAQKLGWEGGSVEDYLDGAAIGGDRFGNYEGLLPEKNGRSYTECDIDTDGYYSRGSRRLIFSNDGLYFYTSDHYESFTEIKVVDGETVWEDNDG